MVKRQGFASFSKKDHEAASSKGGQAHHPNKGFGSKTPEERKQLARKANQARWRKDDQVNNPTEIEPKQTN